MPHRSIPEAKNQQFILRSLAQQVSRAVWLEQEPQIIANLARLANCAMASGYVRPKEGVDLPADHSMTSAVKLIFHIIERCATGKTDSYSDLYDLCTQLTRRLINSDWNQPCFTENINNPASLIARSTIVYSGANFLN